MKRKKKERKKNKIESLVCIKHNGRKLNSCWPRLKCDLLTSGLRTIAIL